MSWNVDANGGPYWVDDGQGVPTGSDPSFGGPQADQGAPQGSRAPQLPVKQMDPQTAITPPWAAGGYNPMQPNYLGAPPSLNPTTVSPTYMGNPATYGASGYNAIGVDPNIMSGLGQGATVQALMAGVDPVYKQQDAQMMQQLAASGVAPGSTAGAGIFDNLARQQLSAVSPAIASAIQNSQGNMLNAGQYNASAGNQGAQFNQGLQQSANAANAGAYNAANQYNANAANAGSQYNAGVQNAASGQNLQNMLQQQLYNSNAYNQAGSNLFNAQTGAYNNNANAFNALNSAGMAGANGLAGQQASGGANFANTAQTQYPVYGGGAGAAAAFGNALGGGGYYGTGGAPSTARTAPNDPFAFMGTGQGF